MLVGALFFICQDWERSYKGMTELERQELERQILEQIRMKQLAYKRAWNAANRERIKRYNRKQYLKRKEKRLEEGADHDRG